MKKYILNRIEDLDNSRNHFENSELKIQVKELLILLDSDFASNNLNKEEIDLLVKKAKDLLHSLE